MLVLVLALLLVGVSCQSLPASPPDTGRTVSFLLDGLFRVSYLLNATHADIAFSASTDGWAAVGVRNAQASGDMVGADIIMFRETAPAVFVCEDKFAAGFAPPVSDTSLPGGTYDILSWGASRTGGIFSARFIRLRATTDRVHDLDLLGPSQPLLFALHSSSNVETDKHTRAGASTLAGSRVNLASTSGMAIAHGALMVIAWAAVLLAGALVARYVPKSKEKWFPAHWILQSAGAVLAAVAAVLIFAFVSSVGHAHISLYTVSRGAHQILGLVLIILMVASVALGVVSHCMYNPSRSGVPAFPDKVHWWVARGALVLGLVNIFLGIWELGGEPAYFAIMGAYFVVIIIAIIILECGRRKAIAEDPGYQLM